MINSCVQNISEIKINNKIPILKNIFTLKSSQYTNQIFFSRTEIEIKKMLVIALTKSAELSHSV